ncbi:MAG: BamA/TamA family outer membrane protein [Bacteroidales bacterium]|nr:BamA/TamA family outer membrane protein [Bacteroidales bacterium]
MRYLRLAIVLIGLAAASACSTTRVLSEGQYRLASNKVVIEGKDKSLSSGDVSSYVKQQANSYFIFGWSPKLIIYNWSDPEKDDWLNRSLRNVGVAPVVFNGYQVGSSCDNIRKHLDYLGYYNSDVTSRVDTTGRLVNVTYFVTPGKRSRIDSIVFKVPEGEFTDEFKADLPKVTIKEGDFLSEKSLEAESVRGATYFRNRGYYDFSKYNYFFEADTLGPRNILTYEIRNYNRNEAENNSARLLKYKIGEVTISHAKDVPFRESVLRKLNLIQPGRTYSERLVNATYNRLTSLRLFNNVGIEMIPADSSTVDCHITMGESKRRGVKLNLDVSTNSSGLLGISPNVSLYDKNIFHGGEWLSLGFSGNFQWIPGTDTKANEFGASVGLNFPRFVGLPISAFRGSNIPRTEILASVNYQNRPEFIRFITNVSYGYTGQTRNFYYQFYPLRVSVVKINGMSEDFMYTLLRNLYLWDSFYDHLDAGISGQVYWTTNADIVPKTAYHYIRFGFDLSGNVISLFNNWLPRDEYGTPKIFGLSYSHYAKADLHLGKVFRFSQGSALALHLAGGVGTGLGKSTMPFEKQFYVGGASSMRGWQVRALGPGDDEMMTLFTIPSQTGDWKLELDMEYRQKLFWKFEGALFAEAGNVWLFPMTDLPEEYRPDPESWLPTIAADWGIGLRLNLDFILIRLDWGLKLYEPSRAAGSRWLTPKQWLGRNGSALHFGVGYPF